MSPRDSTAMRELLALDRVFRGAGARASTTCRELDGTTSFWPPDVVALAPGFKSSQMKMGSYVRFEATSSRPLLSDEEAEAAPTLCGHEVVAHTGSVCATTSC